MIIELDQSELFKYLREEVQVRYWTIAGILRIFKVVVQYYNGQPTLDIFNGKSLKKI